MSRLLMVASTQHRETESVAAFSGFESQWTHQRQLLCHNQHFPAEHMEQQWHPGPWSRRK